MMKDTYYFASPDKSPEQFIELFETFYGPTMNAVDAARKNGKSRNSTLSWWSWRTRRTRARTPAL